MPDIFISYRRGDSAGHAGRLYDGLKSRFDGSQVFIDVDAIAPGVDFVERIQAAVESCDVVLVLIGDNWVSMQGRDGTRRLDNAEDFVRLEIAAALERKVPVVPVLVEGARMPDPEDLPETIRGLARQNAIELSDARWHYDVSRLIEAVSRLGPDERPAAPAAAKPRTTSGRPSRGVLIGGGAGLLALVVVLVVALGGGGSSPHRGTSSGTRAALFGANATTGVAIGGGVNALAGSADTLWAADASAGTVRRLSATSGKPAGPPVSVGKGVTAVSVGQNALWALSTSDRAAVKIDPGSGRPTSTSLTLPKYANGIAAGAGGVWVTVEGATGLLRFDPSTGKQVAAIGGVGHTSQVATGDFSEVAVTGEGKVAFISPDTNRVKRRVAVAATAAGLAFDGLGSVWVASPGQGSVSQVSADSGGPHAVALGGSPSEVAVAGDKVWVADTAQGKLYAVDPRKAAVSGPAIDIGPNATSIAAAGNALWVGYADGHLKRIAP